MQIVKILLIVFIARVMSMESRVNERIKRQSTACGKSLLQNSGLIYGGQSFSRGKWPWMVAMFLRQLKGQKFICSGTLISSVKVLTAAHCVYNKFETAPVKSRDLSLAFGAFNLDELSGTFSATASQIIVHDDWNPYVKSFDADIAIILIEDEVPFTKFIQPICIWDSTSSLAHKEGIIAGWGKSEATKKEFDPIPKELTIPIKSQQDCFLDSPEFAQIASRRTFCGGSRNGRGPCLGDSGSGLYVLHQNAFFLRGIVSASLLDSYNSCDVTNFALYTDTLHFSSWIKNPYNRQSPSASLQATQTTTMQCGVMAASVGLIQGGYFASKDIFPWTVAVHDSNPTIIEWNNLKTGTLISNKHVVIPGGFVFYTNDAGDFITIDTARVTMYFGLYNYDFKTASDVTQTGVSKIILHPNLKNGNPREANIAMLTANKALTFSNKIYPICLQSNLAASTTVVSVGWGTNDDFKLSKQKKYLQMQITQKSECLKAHENILESVLFSKYFCAISKTNSTPCIGDDPLYVKSENRWYLRGFWAAAYRFDSGHCNPKEPTLYEDMTLYTSWFNQEISK